MLELIDIKKRYGSKEVLHGISIKFENGIYGLIGPNGSGKSTIMNIMSDVLDMSSGKILYNGTDIKELDDRYREKIWLFVIAITIHNFPEGMATGVGFGGLFFQIFQNTGLFYSYIFLLYFGKIFHSWNYLQYDHFVHLKDKFFYLLSFLDI